jgi:hypothetical protein
MVFKAAGRCERRKWLIGSKMPVCIAMPKYAMQLHDLGSFVTDIEPYFPLCVLVKDVASPSSTKGQSRHQHLQYRPESEGNPCLHHGIPAVDEPVALINVP